MKLDLSELDPALAEAIQRIVADAYGREFIGFAGVLITDDGEDIYDDSYVSDTGGGTGQMLIGSLQILAHGIIDRVRKEVISVHH